MSGLSELWFFLSYEIICRPKMTHAINVSHNRQLDRVYDRLYVSPINMWPLEIVQKTSFVIMIGQRIMCPRQRVVILKEVT